jgi:hypothetical protein
VSELRRKWAKRRCESQAESTGFYSCLQHHDTSALDPRYLSFRIPGAGLPKKHGDYQSDVDQKGARGRTRLRGDIRLAIRVRCARDSGVGSSTRDS